MTKFIAVLALFLSAIMVSFSTGCMLCFDCIGPLSESGGGGEGGGTAGSGAGGENPGGGNEGGRGGAGGSGGEGGSPPAEGPCGPIPTSGLFVCWVYGTMPVPTNQHVGLAGGSADPDLGQTIQTQFLDPLCVSQAPGVGFVQCDLGAPDANWDIQFRAGLHAAPGTGTTAGTWDCSDTSCAGDVYVYRDGEEVGSLVTNVASGVVSTLPHFNPPGLLNVKVTVP